MKRLRSIRDGRYDCSTDIPARLLAIKESSTLIPGQEAEEHQQLGISSRKCSNAQLNTSSCRFWGTNYILVLSPLIAFHGHVFQRNNLQLHSSLVFYFARRLMAGTHFRENYIIHSSWVYTAPVPLNHIMCILL